MKKLLKIFLGSLSLSVALTACEFETSDNGDLDGLWQLTQQDSVRTGASKDMRSSGVYWAVQVRLLQIQGGSRRGYYRFTHSDGWLRLRPADVDKEGNEDTTTLYSYRVRALNSSKMVLDDDTVRLSFRKY